jgi:hypothetical protein
MKTKTVFCLCLIMGSATIQLSCQLLFVEGTKSILIIKDCKDMQDINRNDKQIEYLRGKVNVHYVLHFKDGNLVWENMHVLGEASINNSDEVFKIRKNDKSNIVQGIRAQHFNQGVNEGSYYKGSIKWVWFKNPLWTFNNGPGVKNKTK